TTMLGRAARAIMRASSSRPTTWRSTSWRQSIVRPRSLSRWACVQINADTIAAISASVSLQLGQPRRRRRIGGHAPVAARREAPRAPLWPARRHRALVLAREEARHEDAEPLAQRGLVVTPGEG